MKKFIFKLTKKLIAFMLVLILCIESFGAVVSDNDGSAFITKAEFDSLKNNFQNQIDQYNNSIDSKIDDAIATYLSGIKIEKNKDISPYISNYDEIRFMHGPYMYFTNRRFTEYTTTAGRYVDTTDWQIINPENRRGYHSDGYLWFHDYIGTHTQMFGLTSITAMLHPYDVPWAYGNHDHRSTGSRGPSIYAALRKEENGWAAYAEDGGIKAERGHISYLYTRAHLSPSDLSTSERNDPISGVNHIYWMKTNYSDTLRLVSNPTGENEIVNYTITGIKYGNASSNFSNGTVQSIIRNDWNPSFIQSNPGNLWAEGDGRLALKTACGAETYQGEDWSRVGDGRVEDNRWRTERQYNCDVNNFIYAMWGSDVVGDTNVAPPLITSDFTYLDLSGSPNTVTVPYKVKSLGIGTQTPYTGNSNLEKGHFQSSSVREVGSFTLTFPLFYRVNWADMLSGEFKFNDKSLCKSDGYPIIVNSPDKGNVKLKISYDERVSIDSSVVILAPDQKIKTYFNNKPFTDPSSTSVKGYTNVDGKGDQVNLNGTEWTKNEITVNIPVEKGGSIWMRIDPLTPDGVYCSMTNYSCTLVSE